MNDADRRRKHRHLLADAVLPVSSVTLSVTVTVAGAPNTCCTDPPLPAGVPSNDQSLAMISCCGVGTEVEVKVTWAPATTGLETVKSAVGLAAAGATAASVSTSANSPETETSSGEPVDHVRMKNG